MITRRATGSERTFVLPSACRARFSTISARSCECSFTMRGSFAASAPTRSVHAKGHRLREAHRAVPRVAPRALLDVESGPHGDHGRALRVVKLVVAAVDRLGHRVE